MRTRILIIGFALLCQSSVAFAHFGGHGNEDGVALSWNEVISVATHHVADLISLKVELKDLGVLDKSWNSVAPSGKKFSKLENGDYIVSFVHPTEKKTLYLLLSSSGDLYEANFSGIFEGVK